MNEVEAISFFEKHGSFCRTGDGTTFALEAFKGDRLPLDQLVVLWGGHVYKPPPAAPSRWTWWLYGRKAKEKWSSLRSRVTAVKRRRGDKKLKDCQEPYQGRRQ